MSGAAGYGVVAKTLHWLTVAVFALQFVVGYVMSTEADCDPPGEDRGGGDTSDAEDERLDRLEDACEARSGEEGSLATAWTDLWGGGIGADGISLPELHILLGLAILLLGGLRVAGRMISSLPPWDPPSDRDRPATGSCHRAGADLADVRRPADGPRARRGLRRPGRAARGGPHRVLRRARRPSAAGAASRVASANAAGTAYLAKGLRVSGP
ncbi:MAG: hypothetical protein ACRDPS_25985 [Nocardioides sp.]|uniref:hypothetical protein n=1 Tax=Nocardioides sp. TaxID=35761 RepID=UPI003D6AEB27